jgi:hypothetical protein
MASKSGQLAHQEAQREAAMALLLEAGAVSECDADPGIYINQHRGTEGARDLGLRLIKVKDRRVSAFKNRVELSDAIDLAFEDAAERCELCAKRAKAGGSG